jgi:hypothetical protein
MNQNLVLPGIVLLITFLIQCIGSTIYNFRFGWFSTTRDRKG